MAGKSTLEGSTRALRFAPGESADASALGEGTPPKLNTEASMSTSPTPDQLSAALLQGQLQLGHALLLQAPAGAGKIRLVRSLLVRLAPQAPFRAPHHTCSHIALLDELCLAAGGILYLDECLEFSRQSLDHLRRVWQRMVPPARPPAHLQLVAVS